MSAQTYWLQKAGGTSADEGYSISIDDSNNAYTTGYFTGTATFGTFSVTASGVSDVFVAKTNSSGVYQWVAKGGDGGSDRGLAITTDANGNSYVTGYYYGTAIFGTYSITSVGLQDVFVVKYDNAGNVQWAVSAGGSQSDIGNAIALDHTGNIVITGQFAGTSVFGTYTLTSTNNSINVFTAKLNAATGTFIWAESGTGPHTDRGLGVACDPSGNIYVTGQYTDTITFTNPHYSPVNNAVFIVKYNSSGIEQWVTTLGGGTSNISNAIAVDNSSNIYVTGNFTGTLNFFVSNPPVTLTQTYTNRIFLAKYDKSGNLLWDVADGSSNPVISNNIALDSLGNPYIIGDFQCIMNSYADHYGQGTFNTVGYWDIFNAGYSSSTGAWQWSRQIGGHGNNYGYGLAVSHAGHVFDAGSFDKDVIITENPTGFLGYNASPSTYCTSSYCSDPNYGDYAYLNTTGDLDIFTAEPIDLTRQPYDYYKRSGNSCSRPLVKVCIGTADTCEDTVQLCSGGTIRAISNSCSPVCAYYDYLWSTGAHTSFITTSTTGWYSVTQTSVDGCITSKDSIYVIIHTPPVPTVSDNVIINTNATLPAAIRVCERSVILTGGNYTGDSTWYWTTPEKTRIDSAQITLTFNSDSGFYFFNVVNKYGCISQTAVWVVIDSALPKIIPKIKCLDCRHDTAFVCKHNGFVLLPYDSISNPSGNPHLCIPPSTGVINNWYVSPDTAVGFLAKTRCPDFNTITPNNSDSGWYYITDSIVQSNACGTKKYVVKDSIYERIYPLPVVTLNIAGSPTVCPGDSEWIVASGTAPFKWSTGSTEDSLYVGVGKYYISASQTNVYGCTTIDTAKISITTFTPVIPAISMNPVDGVICPNDSLQLTCAGGPYQNYQWYGPSGPLAINKAIVFVKNPGNYYCVASDSTPCPFSRLSNTVIVESYATPYLQLPPKTNICLGDSVILKVVASNDAVIQWQPPLSGNSVTQTIKSPGTYTVKIISCGIITTCTTTITESSSVATITAFPSKTICTAGDSIRLSGLPYRATYLWQPGGNSNQLIYIKRADTYSLSTVDTFGCTASADIIISPPLRDSIVKAVSINCKGSNTGLIMLGVSGGTLPYTYSWSPPAGSNAIASNLSAGSYTVSVTDANGCNKTASVTLTQPAQALASNITSFTNVKCFGNYTGAITVTASGGRPSYSYVWATGGETTSTVTGLSAAAYSITVTDINGCTASSSVTLTQPPLLSLTVTEASIICKDSTGNLLANVTGGAPPYSYAWSGGITATSSTATITLTTTMDYSVTVTDANGCTASGQINLQYGPPFSVAISGKNTFCLGDSTTVCAKVTGAMYGVVYSWQPGNNTNACITVKPVVATIYTLTVTDGCGASATAGIPISPEPIPIINFSADVLRGCTPLCVQFYNGITILQGNIQQYIWNFGNGDTSHAHSPIYCYFSSGIYNVSLTAVSDNGCSATLKKVNMITVYTHINAAFTLFPQPATILNPTIQFRDISPNQDGIAYRQWSFGDATDSISYLQNPIHTYLDTGRYCANLAIIDSHGCIDTTTRCLEINPIFTLYIPSAFTPNSDGLNETFTPKGEYIRSFEMYIYDRWGMELYHTTNINEGWNGTVHGGSTISQEDVYVYKITVIDSQGNTHSYIGNVTLLK